jgi:putative endonuclease
MEKRVSLGAWGEEEACVYLVQKHFEILGRNIREPWGELDIVAKSPDRTLVFVEVKTMRDRGPGHLVPEDQMGGGKLDRFRRAAALYAGNHPEHVDPRRGWRLDVLALTVPSDWEPGEPGRLLRVLNGLFRDRSAVNFRHYENV